jgi:hypothetical protein
MKNQQYRFLTKRLVGTIGLVLFFGLKTGAFAEYRITHPEVYSDSLKRKADLARIMKVLPEDRIANGRVSFLDETFKDWLKRTGELPPDFDQMPSIPFLPDPLIEDEGGKNIPITSAAQWKEKRRNG